VNHAMKNWGDQSKQINLADEDAINEIKNVKEWYVFFFLQSRERDRHQEIIVQGKSLS
jgi:hypothetical protein